MNLQYQQKEIVNLKNGATAVFLPYPYTQTVSLGVLVGAGSVTESKETLGYSHFVEHMVFKGTDRFEYEQINMFFEKMGAYINAYTNKYFTLYYVHVLKEFASDALKMLLHIVTESVFPLKEVDKERSVILEEMLSYQDSPDDFTIEQFFSLSYPQSYVGNPIIGTESTLNQASRESLVNYYQNHYVASNMIVSVAGSIDSNEMLKIIENHPFRVSENGKKAVFKASDVIYQAHSQTQSKDIEQTHIAFGFPIEAFNPHKEALYRIFNMILGALSSSRLFLSVREKMALCYHIESQLSQDPLQGSVLIYGSTKPKQAQTLVDTIIKEIINLKNNPISGEELEIAKNQLKSKWVFKKEAVSSLMIKNAVDLYFSYPLTEKEFLNLIDAVSLSELHEFSEDFITKLDNASLFALTPQSYKNKIIIPS